MIKKIVAAEQTQRNLFPYHGIASQPKFAHRTLKFDPHLPLLFASRDSLSLSLLLIPFLSPHHLCLSDTLALFSSPSPKLDFSQNIVAAHAKPVASNLTMVSAILLHVPKPLQFFVVFISFD